MNIQQTLNEPIVANNDSLSFLTKGVLLFTAIGALGLYLMIPERRRKQLFK